jgi:large subunit ribosomal protein L34e|tara:strand:+ start:276 stop:545 length:270 start_codon:yes stop_codon:yes gene_type:complete
MTAPKHRSRSRRKVFVKTASRVLVRYRKRKPSKPKCPECGKVLLGVPNVRATKLKQTSKSKKVPSRKFANLCSSCSRKKLIERARAVKW